MRKDLKKQKEKSIKLSSNLNAIQFTSPVLVMFVTASYFACSFRDSYRNLKFIRFALCTRQLLQLILRKRITLLIHLRHVQVVVGLGLRLLLLLWIKWILSERHDRWVDPLIEAIAKA